METHVRHFVSQRFGKSLVRVDFDDAMAGVVTIVVPGDADKTVAFGFDRAHLARALGDPAPLPEKIMRIAIGQAHKLFVLHGGKAVFGATLPLAAGCAPWIGDLSDARYGGATAGYDAAGETSPHDSAQTGVGPTSTRPHVVMGELIPVAP